MPKKNSKKEETLAKAPARERLLDSAYELFNRDGIHKTGIDKIIKNAGVAKMSFYSHFPSKQDLVLEYLRIRDREWFDLINSFISEAPEPEEKLLQIFEALKAWYDKDNFYGCPFINGLAEFEELSSPAVTTCITQHFVKTEELVADLLQQMGQSKTGLTEKICLQIVGSIVLAKVSKSSAPAMLAKEMTEQILSKK